MGIVVQSSSETSPIGITIPADPVSAASTFHEDHSTLALLPSNPPDFPAVLSSKFKTESAVPSTKSDSTMQRSIPTLSSWDPTQNVPGSPTRSSMSEVSSTSTLESAPTLSTQIPNLNSSSKLSSGSMVTSLSTTSALLSLSSTISTTSSQNSTTTRTSSSAKDVVIGKSHRSFIALGIVASLFAVSLISWAIFYVKKKHVHRLKTSMRQVIPAIRR